MQLLNHPDLRRNQIQSVKQYQEPVGLLDVQKLPYEFRVSGDRVHLF